eukprot:2942396-Pyramimonas_sp.AAC.1
MAICIGYSTLDIRVSTAPSLGNTCTAQRARRKLLQLPTTGAMLFRTANGVNPMPNSMFASQGAAISFWNVQAKTRNAAVR